MAISIQPVDGLINRLLQQNSRSTSVSERRSNHSVSRSQDHSQDHSQDQISISAKAETQRQSGHQANRPVSGQEKTLESHLLSLYKMNDSPGV